MQHSAYTLLYWQPTKAGVLLASAKCKETLLCSAFRKAVVDEHTYMHCGLSPRQVLMYKTLKRHDKDG
jgi:hypothetical protein